MTTRYDLPPTHPVPDSQDGSVPPPPWMPLDALIQQWASVGVVARSPETLTAVSAAFAALAAEREALALYSRQHEHHAHFARMQGFDAAAPWMREQPIITALTHAATHWFEVAGALSYEAFSPSGEQQEDWPADLNLQALIGQALLQRERVGTIALALVSSQTHHAPVCNGYDSEQENRRDA